MTTPSSHTKRIPFDFVIDHLPLSVTVKPMFGMFAIYLDRKIVLVLRDTKKSPQKNGVWIAIGTGDLSSLKNDLPGLAPISLRPAGKTHEAQWQYLSVDLEDFEALVIRACELVKKNDPRIGHVPNTPKHRTDDH